MLHARDRKNLEKVYKHITKNKLTMVTKERFVTIDLIAKYIRYNDLPGDVMECGCWRGGMSIYMAYSFPEKTCWVSDSFQGFEPIEQSKYDPRNKLEERHVPEGWIGTGISVEEHKVRKNFLKMGLSEKTNVFFLPGWVNDTTDPLTCPVKELALLRIDVDAYSATLVVLENLYDKVVPGGFIIFDDTGLYETEEAIKEFERKRNISIVANLKDPSGIHVGRFTGQHGLFYQKPF